MGTKKHGIHTIVRNGEQLWRAIQEHETVVKIQLYSSLSTVARRDADGKTREYLHTSPFKDCDSHLKVLDPDYNILNVNPSSDGCVLWYLTNQSSDKYINSEAIKMALLPESVCLPKLGRIFAVYAPKRTKLRVIVEQTRAEIGLDEYCARLSSAKLQLPFEEWRSIACQTLYGLNVLHMSAVLHSDPNQGNIMIKFADNHDNIYEHYVTEYITSVNVCSSILKLETNMEGRIFKIPLFNGSRIMLIDYDLTIMFDPSVSIDSPETHEWTPSCFTPTFDLIYLIRTWKCLARRHSCLMSVTRWIDNFEHWVARLLGLQHFEMYKMYVCWEGQKLPNVDICENIRIPLSLVMETFFMDYFDASRIIVPHVTLRK